MTWYNETCLENVTTLAGQAGCANTAGDGMVFSLILLTTAIIILFIALRTNDFKTSFFATSFITTIVAIPLMAINLIPGFVLLLCFIALLAGIIVKRWGGD